MLNAPNSKTNSKESWAPGPHRSNPWCCACLQCVCGVSSMLARTALGSLLTPFVHSFMQVIVDPPSFAPNQQVCVAWMCGKVCWHSVCIQYAYAHGWWLESWLGRPSDAERCPRPTNSPHSDPPCLGLAKSCSCLHAGSGACKGQLHKALHTCSTGGLTH